MSDEHGEGHEPSFYIKIYLVLLVLLGVSIIGPEFGIKWVTLVTAFGVALVKAYMVAVNFMHINMTPRFVIYSVTTTLVFMLLFFAGTAPDVMKNQGTNWKKPAWIEAERAFAAGEVSGVAGHGEDHGSGHGEDHGDGHGEGH